MTRRSAVVTGIGVVAPGGVGRGAFWDRLLSGESAMRTITLFDADGYRSRVAAEVDLAPEDIVRPVTGNEADRSVLFALRAAKEALDEAGGVQGEPDRVGVSIGTAVGNTMALEEHYVRLSGSGSSWVVDASQPPQDLYRHLVPSTASADVARLAGAEGPVHTVSTGCTSGLDAVAHGAEMIEEGSCDVVVAGATDAPISPISVACFDSIRATTPDNDDPVRASRPFARDRSGFVLGEGAAVVILEEEEAARARGARIYCRIAGFAQRANAFHMTGLKNDGLDLAEAISSAFERSGLRPEHVDYVNAHGSGTKQNDRHETAAFKKALGSRAYEVPVSSIKSVVGHSLGAVGAIEVAACALAMEHGVVPPTANLHDPDPELDLDYVPLSPREHRSDTVLSVGSGFGGFQTAMLLTRVDGGTR